MTAELNVNRVSVDFAGEHILNKVDFRVRSGEFVGIIGPNGAGKSTLLKVILGLVPPGEGSASLMIEGEPAERPSRRIGYVPQSRQIDPDNPIRAWDFISLNLPASFRPWLSIAEKRKIAEALELTQAEHLAHKAVGSMSGGEKQKIFLAQALVSDPLLLLLDEPTSNLDPGAQEKMASVVSAISRERRVGVLFISHDINLISQYADFLLFLTRGHHAFGSVEQIMRPDVLTGLYGMKVEVGRSGGRYVVLPEAERSAAICFHEEAHGEETNGSQPLLLGGK